MVKRKNITHLAAILLTGTALFLSGLDVVCAEDQVFRFRHPDDVWLTDISLSLATASDMVLLAEAVADSPVRQESQSLNAGEEAGKPPLGDEADTKDEFYDPFASQAEKPKSIADPIQPVNRPLFVFNDKVYFWVLKPVAQGYGNVVPEPVRRSVSRFFLNLRAPVRFVNCLLQGKGKGALNELGRFTINSTAGIVGFFDPAANCFDLRPYQEDFGQTLGRYRAGPGFFLTIPFTGPSSLRDTVGEVVDILIVPTWYVISNYGLIYTGVRAFEAVNTTSLTIGEYEDLKASAIDPYIAIRDAYYEHREDLIKR